MNDKPKTWNIPVRTAEGRELQRKYAEAWPGLEGTKAMIQLNLDDIEAVLDRANDDADRVSVYEYREALNAVYRTAMRILSEKMALEAERIELRGTVANLSTSLDCSSERHIWELEDLRTERDELKTRLAHVERERDDTRRELRAVGATTAPLYTSQEREVLIRERDEARAELARREREREALLETAQKALAHAERERDELRLACDGCADSEHKTGRAHYDDCPVGVAVRERDEARAEVARLSAQLESITTEYLSGSEA
jgi:chromosome segregation ATPase